MIVIKRILPTMLALAFVLFGCAWWQRPPLPGASPERLYQRGYEDYQKGRYERAIEAFQRLKEEYPLSKLAILAELGIADAYFSDGEYGEAEAYYSDFINLHPTNENLPYALYQLGMCHYKQMPSIDRDQTETLKAKKEFEALLTRFPSSKFAFLAEKMLRECKRKLAEHEFYVGEFYFRQKQYTAALKRFEGIARQYQDVGLDYKVNYFISETKRRLAQQEPTKK
ncbi:MAG: outer membrane protein assembly factor BamD [Deltaproteobacteria bacterium]|nr:outer membrane protein assembly factor BamD [Deltaproteobacteria bacterium]